MQAVPQLLEHLRQESSKVIVGQEEFRDQCLATLLCRGHALLEGVPGVAKTLLVKTLARILGLEFQRVQCTSDLMPADIIGTNVLNMATSAFNLHKGPVFTDMLLVDERLTACAINCRPSSVYSLRKIQWSLKGHIPCRKRSSTAFC